MKGLNVKQKCTGAGGKHFGKVNAPPTGYNVVQYVKKGPDKLERRKKAELTNLGRIEHMEKRKPIPYHFFILFIFSCVEAARAVCFQRYLHGFRGGGR